MESILSNIREQEEYFRELTKRALEDVLRSVQTTTIPAVTGSDTKAKEEQKRLSTNETVMSYLKDKEDSYYVELYKEIIGEEESASEDAIEIGQSIDEVLDMVAVEQSVIDFLSENKGQWTVQDGIIAFSDEALNVQYNQLLLELE